MRTVPPNRFDPGFECELPESFFLGPKRPRILIRPQPAKKVRSRGWLYVLLLAAVVLGALVIWSTSQRKPVHEQVSVPEPITAPTPAIVPRFVSPAPAPRAVLIKLPPPRAQLIRLPEWRVDTERQLLMPSGLKVLGRLRGSLVSTDMLPANGNEIGDTWIVGDTAWVWLTQPGMTQASWLDP